MNKYSPLPREKFRRNQILPSVDIGVDVNRLFSKTISRLKLLIPRE